CVELNGARRSLAAAVASNDDRLGIVRPANDFCAVTSALWTRRWSRLNGILLRTVMNHSVISTRNRTAKLMSDGNLKRFSHLRRFTALESRKMVCLFKTFS